VNIECPVRRIYLRHSNSTQLFVHSLSLLSAVRVL
jgi:hypothetical protein